MDSPYKIIAADANISNTITPIDIVELRKLILGIYSELPNNTSWRFITKSFSFSTSNPFEDIPFEEAISVELPILDADFVAIKVGDVNGSALVCSNCTAPRLTAPEPFGLTVPNVPVKAGDYVTIPVMANDQAALIAWQLGLRFDADRLELVGPALGDLNELYADNFGLTRADEGMLRVSWVARLQDEDGHLNIHDRLFYLTFRAKDNVTDISALLQLDNEVLANRGWLLDGTEYRLELQNSPVANRSMPSNNELSVSSRPNPAGKEAWLDVALPVTGRVRLSVYNSFGVRMLFREMELPAGAQTLALPEVANWSPGIYRYDLQAGKARGRGHLVKQ